MKLLDLSNQYINENEPWKIKKDNFDKLHIICTMGINLFRLVMIFLKPIVPDLAKRTELFLISDLTWKSIKTPLLRHKIKKFITLYNRIDIDQISKLSFLCK